jgi:hypothetical protein
MQAQSWLMTPGCDALLLLLEDFSERDTHQAL